MRRFSKDWGFMLSETEYSVVAGPYPIHEIDFYGEDDGFGDGGAAAVFQIRNVTSERPCREAKEIHAVMSYFEVGERVESKTTPAPACHLVTC